MIDPLTVERAADAAWPSAERVPLGPWTMRATAGVTRRTNSVFTAGREDVADRDMARLVDAAERFYAGRGLPTVFQISAATGSRGLDAMLEARGYVLNARSEVWTAPAGRPERAAVAGPALARHDDPSREWFDVAFAEDAADRRAVHEEIVRRSLRPRMFASARVGGRLAGCAMAVSGVGGHTGLFCMTTAPAFRRRGLGRALVAEVCAWAAERGDERVYLQVSGDNEAAKGLYRAAGFGRAYDYHYRVKG